MTVVRKFHEAFGQPAPASPPLKPDRDLVMLRLRLIREEYQEGYDELATLALPQSVPETFETYRRLLKELADLRYVLEGAAVAFGLPIDEAFTVVHRSNMSKLGVDGKPIYREDGKALKGPCYAPPDMLGLVPSPITIPEEDIE